MSFGKRHQFLANGAEGSLRGGLLTARQFTNIISLTSPQPLEGEHYY